MTDRQPAPETAQVPAVLLERLREAVKRADRVLGTPDQPAAPTEDPQAAIAEAFESLKALRQAARDLTG